MAEAADSVTPGVDLEEVAGWTGHRLDELGGATVGRIEGCYVDATGGRPEWLLARMGRFGHHCLIPARDAVGAVGHVWVPYTRDQIRGAPRIEPGTTVDREAELELLAHYGVGAKAGRAGELAERDQGTTTARPAG